MKPAEKTVPAGDLTLAADECEYILGALEETG